MKYITAKQYKQIKDIPRGRMTARFLLYTGVIIEEKNRILLCYSKDSKYKGWQLPGGKVLWSESLIDCIHREVIEETGLSITLDSILGIYQRDTGPEDEEFLRMIFIAKSFKEKKNVLLDPAIEKSKWFNVKDILNGKVPLQSQQILKEVEEYTEGKRYPLELLSMYKW